MRLLILSRYSSLGASSRMRTYQYVPSLKAQGFDVTASSFFDDHYLRRIYGANGWLAGRVGAAMEVWSAMVQRFSSIIMAGGYDAIWLEKEVFPYLPGFFEKLLCRRGIPYVVDYDDAIFHNYDLSSSRVVRAVLGRKLVPLVSGAVSVTVGNNYLRTYAETLGARSVCVIPTVVDVERYRATSEVSDDEFRVGWIGSPSTVRYLDLIKGALQTLSKERAVRLVTVGAPEFSVPGVRMERHEWTEATEASLIETFHIGVMPLFDTPWEKGKCGYKLIQYMASGRAVIGSSVGVNPDIIGPCAGYVATTEEDWLRAFRCLAESRSLRSTMGAAGRRRVEQFYSLQVMAPRVGEILLNATRSPRV